ncbi:MAG: SCO family protein [Acidobacteriota bacterium]
MRNFIIVLCIAFVVSACQKTTDSGTMVPSANNASATAKRYPIKGTVISVDRAGKKVKLEHDDIPGFMEAMTMDFPVHDDWVWDDMVAGAEIRGDLVVDNTAKDPFWIEKIGISAANPGLPAPPINENFAQIGKSVPDFTLTNQDGKRLSLNDFRGKTLAITFIYAKCPLPDYCIRMSTNFSDLARQIAADPESKDKFRLLSVSFDPANDTPDKLRSYGIGYMGNDSNFKFDVWQLAVGKDDEVRKIADFFGLRYEVDATDKTTINHSLRTAVIDPDGKVAKIFPGNDWTPADLLRALRSASSGAPK